MNPILTKNQFLVKEHVGMFKAANSYDILDLESQQPLLECREPNLGFFTKMFRFTKYKTQTPFDIEVRDGVGQEVLRLTRGISFFRSTVQVFDSRQALVGSFRQHLLSLGGKLDVLDTNEQVICSVEGKIISFDYRFLRDGEQIALVTKKWMGLGKELFTSADNYVISIEPTVPATDPIRAMIVAAALCIDMVFAE
ncbi:phospholipid scramblase-related protein [Hymenobacter sp. IS2118]|uniref:phospholipid scramblase-related protein n=1 Tax=Hymenobacter sp. IS2118 TaxID=1505605 RepID=UPI000555C4C3|nr:phospholipid scramblase-related protein [Hymenobacter sp. IS2118]